MKICSVDKCDRKHQAKGFCAAHYKRSKKETFYAMEAPIVSIELKECSISLCRETYYALDMCRMHWVRYNKGQDVLSPKFGSQSRLKHPLYNTWRSMKQRCFNSNSTAYRYYGGRGITICDYWLGKNGFTNFINDMGKRPTKNHSIDRIDNDGNYEPNNCKWSTKKQQIKNRRISIRKPAGR